MSIKSALCDCHLLNQSRVTQKPIVTCLHAFSCASFQLHVFVCTSDRFIQLSATVVIATVIPLVLVLVLRHGFFYWMLQCLWFMVFMVYSFRVTSLLGKKFCPSCGNNTLMKVSVSVDENGVTRYQVPSSKKPFNIRGKKVSTFHVI